MVTPGYVLVPPIWHFILLYHPAPSAFPSPHTEITLIMIIAVMIMITTAKLPSFSLIFNTKGIMIDWKAAFKCFPHSIFSASLDLSLFLPLLLLFFVFFYLFGFSYFPCYPRSLLTPSPAHLLSSVFFNFMAAFHLCCCAPFNLSWSILPSPLVHCSLLFSRFSANYMFSRPVPLFSSNACSSSTKKQGKFNF